MSFVPCEFQKWDVLGEPFMLPSRFSVVSALGSGSYGTVCAALDKRYNHLVAIKKCRKIFNSKTLAKRTVRELRLLRLLKHDNIIRLQYILMPVDIERFNDIYAIFEAMETDLAQLILSRAELTPTHIQFFFLQLVCGLEFMHGVHVMHRDLKPRNLLINSNCCLKIADFGLARNYTRGSPPRVVTMTSYVTTRWYRAPEVIVGWSKYTTAVDMWAAGCILAEMVLRSPLFPGCNTQQQLELICSGLGKPPTPFIASVRNSTFKAFLMNMPEVDPSAGFHTRIQAIESAAIREMITRLIVLNPTLRLSASAALHELYLKELHQKATAAGVSHLSDRETTPLFTEDDFDFENNVDVNCEDYRREILHEVHSHAGLKSPPQSPTSANDLSNKSPSTISRAPSILRLPMGPQDADTEDISRGHRGENPVLAGGGWPEVLDAEKKIPEFPKQETSWEPKQWIFDSPKSATSIQDEPRELGKELKMLDFGTIQLDELSPVREYPPPLRGSHVGLCTGLGVIAAEKRSTIISDGADAGREVSCCSPPESFPCRTDRYWQTPSTSGSNHANLQKLKEPSSANCSPSEDIYDIRPSERKIKLEGILRGLALDAPIYAEVVDAIESLRVIIDRVKEAKLLACDTSPIAPLLDSGEETQGILTDAMAGDSPVT